jgi:hypothetical protein
MWDMILAEEFSMNKKQGDTTKKDATPAFQQVFKIHHTTKDAFYKSLHFYESHANLNKTLIDSVNAFANRQRQDL